MNNVRKEVPCYFCGVMSSEKVIYFDGILRIVKCRTCGLMYQNPGPSESTLHRCSYSEDYFTNYMRVFEKQRKYFFERYKLLFRAHRDAKVLDIGCGTGSFLSVARECGMDAYGVEVSQWAAQIARQKVGGAVITGTLADAMFGDGMFDIIHMSHLLEHCEDPGKILLEAGRVLKRGGILLIEVPNERHFRTRLYIVNALRKIFLQINEPIRPYPEHLFLYTKKTLRRIILQSGLEVVSIHVEGFSNPYRFWSNVVNYRPILKILQVILMTRMDVFLGLGYYITVTAMKK